MGAERLIELSTLADDLIEFRAKQKILSAAGIAGATALGGFSGAGYGHVIGSLSARKEHKKVQSRMKLDQVSADKELKNYPHIKQIKGPEDVPESLGGFRRLIIQEAAKQAQQGKNAFALPANKKHGDFVGFPKRANRSLIQHEIGHIRDSAQDRIKPLDIGIIGDLRGTTLKRERAAWDYVEDPDQELMDAGLASYKKREKGTRIGAGVGAAIGATAGILARKHLTRLNSKLDNLIEFRGGVGLGAGRNHNPLYDPAVNDRVRRPHRIGEGVERSIPLSRIVSPQATINGRRVRSMKDKIMRGDEVKRKTLPTVQRSGTKFIIHDGNHGLAAMLRAGKRTARVLVQ